MKAICNETYLNKRVIKEGLKKLTLCNYNTLLKKGDIPNTVEELYLLRYNQDISLIKTEVEHISRFNSLFCHLFGFKCL
jgi:hypothetical protein